MLFKIDPPEDLRGEGGERLVAPSCIEGGMGGMLTMTYKADTSDNYQSAYLNMRWDFLEAAINGATAEGKGVLDLTADGQEAIRTKYENPLRSYRRLPDEGLALG